MEQDKACEWVLNHGCWRDTITSRDSTIETFSSREEAIKQLNEYRNFYRRIGYSIWFAELTAASGLDVMMAAIRPEAPALAD